MGAESEIIHVAEAAFFHGVKSSAFRHFIQTICTARVVVKEGKRVANEVGARSGKDSGQESTQGNGPLDNSDRPRILSVLADD